MTNDNKPYSPVTKQASRISELVLQNRFARALEEGVARYPIFRELRFAANRPGSPARRNRAMISLPAS
jgi:hypothetical protein